MYLLDTNVVSELRKIRLGKADSHVAEWADSVDAADLYLSAITIQELEIGVLLAERRDPSQGAVFRAWLTAHVLLPSLAASWPSIPLLLNAAHDSMCQTLALFVTGLSLRRRWYTA